MRKFLSSLRRLLPLVVLATCAPLAPSRLLAAPAPRPAPPAAAPPAAAPAAPAPAAAGAPGDYEFLIANLLAGDGMLT